MFLELPFKNVLKLLRFKICVTTAEVELLGATCVLQQIAAKKRREMLTLLYSDRALRGDPLKSISIMIVA